MTEFYQSVTSWPTAEVELNAVARNIGKLLGLPLVAIAKVGGERQSALFCAVGSLHHDAMAEYLRAKTQQLETQYSSQSGGGMQVHQFQVEGEAPPWKTVVSLPYLAAVNISGENRPSLAGSRMSRRRVDFAWVYAASPKALSGHDEVLLLAVAQRLAALAEISTYETALQLRSQFLSIASHELKTPLTSIYGILQLQERLLRNKKDEPEQQARERQESYLKMVIRQVQRLNEMIDGLLDVSRIQNGRFAVEPSDVDVAAVVRETASLRLGLIAQEAGVRLNVEAPESMHAWVDPVRMEEVVTNLVMNAIRFSPEGGLVWIRLRDDQGLLRLTVHDQGPSMSVEDRERIFQPFERAPRTSRMGGLGLGLFISRQIAQLHGGNVSLIESLPVKGNTFEAIFPLRAPTAASA